MSNLSHLSGATIEGTIVRQDAHRSSSGSDTRLLVAVARAYYVDGKSKVEIAEKFGVSRFQVARMLDDAQELGIVRIEIRDPDSYSATLNEQVARALGIERASVVETSESDPGETTERVGRGVVDLLKHLVRPQMTVGMSWSRTLDVAARSLPDLPPCDLVQLAGALQLSGSGMLLQMITQMGHSPGTHTWPMYAPLVVDEASTAQDLRRQPEIAHALERADKLDLAVVSIGAWQDGESTVWEKVAASDREAGTRAGAVAEISGRLLDASGRAVRTPLDDRTIAVSLDQLVKTPEVIALSRGRKRVPAVRAAVASGIVTSLVIDSELAAAILEQADEDVPTS